MKEQVTNLILTQMMSELSEKQLAKLKDVVTVALADCDLISKSNEVIQVNNSWEIDLRDFLIQKKLEGKAQSTLKQYKYQLYKMLSYINKSLNMIAKDDVYKYMVCYKASHKSISNRSMGNMRLCFSTFFNWAFIAGRTSNNIMITIKRIKYDDIIKKPFTDEERELLYCNSTNIRNIAIMEFLYSTAVRVSELVGLNISDIDFQKRELIVKGKGNKERIVYMNAKSTLYLSQYLRQRNDNNEALFVSLKKPNNRLTVSAIEGILRSLGIKCGIPNVHPHRFRRTSATNALNRGMELQYVQKMLGHSKPDTTMLYCSVLDSTIKLLHDKYLAA